MVPHWPMYEKIGYKMINARAETVFTKPACKSAGKKHPWLLHAVELLLITKRFARKYGFYAP
ncbi:hypothetical protein [Desulfovermiculus halophilus]|uniref:hypothetical protein n=1 Tax=Desulfovermiculus halophilus TaxID=339722 RepID=UPI003CC5E9BA